MGEKKWIKWQNMMNSIWTTTTKIKIKTETKLENGVGFHTKNCEIDNCYREYDYQPSKMEWKKNSHTIKRVQEKS